MIDLGLALRFGGHVPEATEQRAHFPPEPACKGALQRWLEGDGCRTVTWNTLAGPLKDAHLEPVKEPPSEAFKISASETGESNSEFADPFLKHTLCTVASGVKAFTST